MKKRASRPAGLLVKGQAVLNTAPAGVSDTFELVPAPLLRKSDDIVKALECASDWLWVLGSLGQLDDGLAATVQLDLVKLIDDVREALTTGGVELRHHDPSYSREKVLRVVAKAIAIGDEPANGGLPLDHAALLLNAVLGEDCDQASEVSA